MLITHEVASGRSSQGCLDASLSQLREELACPESLTDDSRQRLLELNRLLTRLTALDGEYSRVSFSKPAVSALQCTGAVA
jgi:hypothetical protein